MTRIWNSCLAALVALALASSVAAQAPAKKTVPPQPAPPSTAPAATKPAATKPAAPATPKPSAQPTTPTSNMKPQPQPPATPPVSLVPPADSYSYHPEGRRDPFVSLINRGTDARQARKVEGLAGLSAADATLKGIIQGKGGFVGIVQGPDGKRNFTVHPNDRFADGIVKAITADSILILQEVNDPLSLTKQREIRKTLRAVEEVK